MQQVKKISVIGSTGSIGRQTLEIARAYPDKIKVVALAAGSNATLLTEQVREFRPQIAALSDESKVAELRENLAGLGVEVVSGLEGMVTCATLPEAEIIVTAVSGAVGLLPTIQAIKKGKTIALANKETLVAAGELVTELAREYQVSILPVDSEHSAIFQSLQGSHGAGIAKILLTASGGPFRGWTRDKLAEVTPAQALRHPNWTMGRKITIDSATLMNKGLEVIEARWLFDVPFNKIQVVVHPQSIIHSMVEYVDGSVIGQMGVPDMKLPIQYALSYPERWQAGWPRLDWWKLGSLTFEEPDLENFTCLRLAYQAGEQGGTLPAVLNAANEQAVALFLEGRLGFLQIGELLERTLELHRNVANPELEDILAADKWAREEILRLAVNC